MTPPLPATKMKITSPLPVTMGASSTSRRIIEHVTRTFSFEVTNYLQLKDAGFHARVTWPVFSFGGHDWQIAFYPDDEEGPASSYLRYLGPAKEVRAKFTLSVPGNEGQPPLVRRDTPERVFTPEHRRRTSQGFLKFVAKSKLDELGDGRFTIRCVLTVVRDRAVSPPPPELPGLERMLSEGTGADVTFRVGGREFRAHRFLLAARSPVFGAQLFGPMPKKGTRRVVEVVGVEPAIFQMLLHYVYTGSLPVCRDEGKYGPEKLKLMCEEELCRRIDEEAVVTTYVPTNQRSCIRPKDGVRLELRPSKKVLGTVLEFKERFISTCCRPLALEGVLGTKGGRDEDEELDQSKKFKRTRTKY
uniref:TD and POZ domain-containing protein 2 n=1 Tax=Aegilops tauschii TaxID=37682 RepID=N1QUH6_AEGTA